MSGSAHVMSVLLLTWCVFSSRWNRLQKVWEEAGNIGSSLSQVRYYTPLRAPPCVSGTGLQRPAGTECRARY